MSQIDESQLHRINHYSRRQYIVSKMRILGKKHQKRLISDQAFDKEMERLLELLKSTDILYNEELRKKGYDPDTDILSPDAWIKLEHELD